MNLPDFLLTSIGIATRNRFMTNNINIIGIKILK